MGAMGDNGSTQWDKMRDVTDTNIVPQRIFFKNLAILVTEIAESPTISYYQFIM